MAAAASPSEATVATAAPGALANQKVVAFEAGTAVDEGSVLLYQSPRSPPPPRLPLYPRPPRPLPQHATREQQRQAQPPPRQRGAAAQQQQQQWGGRAAGGHAHGPARPGRPAAPQAVCTLELSGRRYASKEDAARALRWLKPRECFFGGHGGADGKNDDDDGSKNQSGGGGTAGRVAAF